MSTLRDLARIRTRLRGFTDPTQQQNGVESEGYQRYLQNNEITDSGPGQGPMDYNYLEAMRNNVNRSPNGHFPDKFKQPWHESFSNESQYYKPGMPAVQWVGNKPTPATGQPDLDSILRRLLIKRR